MSDEEIKRGADAFAAAMKARLEERAASLMRDPPIRNGRVLYKILTREPRVIQARVVDGKDREWIGLGPTLRDAFHSVLIQVEQAAGRGDETARTLLGVIERAPRYALPRKGPAQGGLL